MNFGEEGEGGVQFRLFQTGAKFQLGKIKNFWRTMVVMVARLCEGT